MLNPDPTEETLRNASDWFARLNGGGATAGDRARHEVWLSASAENRAAYVYVSETTEFAARALAPTFGARRSHTPVPSLWGPPLAAAASLVVVVGAGVLAGRGAPAPEPALYETATGEVRTVDLADGTRLTLSGATRLAVTFDRRRREIDLTGGEFFVSVGKDPSRPFRVRAGGRTIEDVGTEFDVNLRGADVEVAVREGEITILPEGGSDRTAMRLTGGHAVAYAPGRPPGATREIEAGRVGLWRTGMLTYDHVPLEWLVADLNRQFKGGITIADQRVASLTVTLTLKLRDRDSTIATLEKLLPIRAIGKGADSVSLVAAGS